MILVRISMKALPEKQKELRQTLLSLINIHEKKDWCLSFGVFCDIEDISVFNLISEFETRKHLYQYLRSDKFTVLLGTRSLLSKPYTIRIHTISTPKGIESVNTIRKKMKSEGDLLV